VIFEQKPPRVEAVQWDGTVDGAQVALDLLRKSSASASFFVETRLRDGKPDSRIKFDSMRGYVRGAETVTMFPDDWFVLHHDGRVDILTNSEFKREYKEVE